MARASWLTASRGEQRRTEQHRQDDAPARIRIQPLDGGLRFGNAGPVGFLARLRDAAIRGDRPRRELPRRDAGHAGEARGYLARFLFQGDDVFKEVRLLSGGERSGLELALLGSCHPTCSSWTSRRTTSTSLPGRRSRRSWPTPATNSSSSRTTGGCSRRICDRLWVVDDGLAVPFDGGYRAWRSAIADGWTRRCAPAQAEARRLHGGRPAWTTWPWWTSAPALKTAAAAGAGASTRVGPAFRTGGGARDLPKDAYRRQKRSRPTGSGPCARTTSSSPPASQASSPTSSSCASWPTSAVALEAAEEAWLETEERAPCAPTGPFWPGWPGPNWARKSTVGGWLAARGAAVIDADVVAREVTAPGTPGHERRARPVGSTVSRNLDRAALARVVLADADALPGARGDRPSARPATDHAPHGVRARHVPAVAIDAIELVDGGLADLCDEVWWVACDNQRVRLDRPRHGDPADADRRRPTAQEGMKDAVLRDTGRGGAGSRPPGRGWSGGRRKVLGSDAVHRSLSAGSGQKSRRQMLPHAHETPSAIGSNLRRGLRTHASSSRWHTSRTTASGPSCST